MEALFVSVRTHLSQARGLSSLRFQNHLYGCYLLLEDIVQKNVTLNGTIVQGKVPFDLRRQFAEIGLRYGFAMDTQLLFTSCPSDYQEAWIQILTSPITLEEVDVLEDKMNEIIQHVVPAEDGFFVSTAETGALPPQWVDRALALLLPVSEVVSVVPMDVPSVPSVVAEVPSVVASVPSVVAEVPVAVPSVPSVKPVPSSILEKHKDNPKRMFASTRRKKVPPKKLLATTRRKTHV